LSIYRRIGFAGKKGAGGVSLRANAEVLLGPPLLSDANGKLDPLPALKRFNPLDPHRVMEITFEVARLRRKPLTETPRREEQFSAGTPMSSSALAPQSKTSMVTRKLG